MPPIGCHEGAGVVGSLEGARSVDGAWWWAQLCGGGRVVTAGAGSGGGSGPLGPLAVFKVVEVVGDWVVPPVPVFVEGGGPSS